jgi:non-ribosomal peptide synthetase component F/acyl carrier protein
MHSPEIGRLRDGQPNSGQSNPATLVCSADSGIPLQRDRASVWVQHSPAEFSALQDAPGGLPALFDAVVAHWPDAKALVSRTGQVTFRELDRSSRTLAATLEAHGAARGEIVAFRMLAGAPMRHRLLFLATQIAAFRLGCALLPLGQQQPPAQTAAQIKDLGARFVIDATAALDDPPGWAAGAHRESIPGFADTVLTVRRRVEAGPELPAGTAVVLTTSGTTGTPKAICLSGAMLLGFLHGIVATGTVAGLPWLMGANIGFDMALADVWLPWLHGQPVIVLETERRTPSALAEAHRLGARVVSLSPSVAAAALRDDAACFARFHTLALIGEILPRSLARRLGETAPGLAVINGYGPAETAVLATVCRVVAAEDGPVPLGRALPGYRVVIADPETLGPLPRHSPGELLIASAAPALGYVDRKTSAEKFVELPGEAPGPFMRTGDIGWVDDRGELQLVGRNDRQVKIAGVRIELDGIEHVIDRVPGVAQVGAVALKIQDAPRVIAVVQPSPAVTDRAALRTAILAHCRDWLPRAAIPAKIVFIDAMPTGGSGKKSHSALVAMLERDNDPVDAADDRALSEPGTIEARIASIWAELLHGNGVYAGPINLSDDVFYLGASSLDTILMAERIERAFAVRIADDQLFLHTTIADQAALIRAAMSEHAAEPIPDHARGAISHRVIRTARRAGHVRGSAISPPELGGGAPHMSIVAANALDDYDILACTIPLTGKLLTEDGLWFETARAIAGQILSGQLPRPAVLIGFSIAGWMSWFIDRLLVAAGADATPVINLDGGVLHLNRQGWMERIEPLLPAPDTAPPARMLVVNRANPGRFILSPRSQTDWAPTGARINRLTVRSVVHMDCSRPGAIRGFREIFAAFASDPDRDCRLEPPLSLSGTGAALFEMLDSREPPRGSEMRDLLGALPAAPIEHAIRIPLLFLAVCTGEAELALGTARRLSAEDPGFRHAVYAEVAILSELKRREAAAARAAEWISLQGADAKMQARAEPRSASAGSWTGGADLALGSDASLDFAAGFCA